MAERKWLDKLYNGIADAVADIREKVVEEPWYGRAVTEREPAMPQWPEAREPEPADTRDNAQQNQERDTVDREIER
jgi:hypothetical protein